MEFWWIQKSKNKLAQKFPLFDYLYILGAQILCTQNRYTAFENKLKYLLSMNESI